MVMTDNSTSDGSGSVSLPRSQLFWMFVGISILLIVMGVILGNSVMAGILGLWGISLLVVVVIGYTAYQMWYQSEA